MHYSIVAGIAVIFLAAVGFLLWYRQKVGGRPVPAVLRPGQALPDFAAVDEHGNVLNTETLRGSAAVILFSARQLVPVLQSTSREFDEAL